MFDLLLSGLPFGNGAQLPNYPECSRASFLPSYRNQATSFVRFLHQDVGTRSMRWHALAGQVSKFQACIAFPEPARACSSHHCHHHDAEVRKPTAHAPPPEKPLPTTTHPFCPLETCRMHAVVSDTCWYWTRCNR